MHIVIIGGSFAGVHLAQLLETHSSHTITLITPNSYFYYNIGSPRILVSTEWRQALVIPLDKAFKKTKLIHTTVTKVEASKVICEDGKEITFDKCVVAVGSRNRFPWKLDGRMTKEELETKLDDLTTKVEKAKSIAVIGGGAVGIEVIGELCSVYRDKQVTLIESGMDLVKVPKHKSFQNKIESSLKTFTNLTIMRGTRVTSPSLNGLDNPLLETELELSNGEKLKPELTLIATGMIPNSVPGLPTDDKGFIRVDPKSLSVPSMPNVYAFGDCTNIEPYPLSAFIKLQAHYLSHRLSHSAHTPYKPQTGPLMGLTIGKKMAAGVVTVPVVGPMSIPAFAVQSFKGDFAAGGKWKELGHKMPDVE